MPHASIRRLALADLDEEALRRLVEHGEDLFVERKQQQPEGSGLGAAVASFANTLGGWLLVGVADDKTVTGWVPSDRVDAQSHFGQVLTNQVDPLPPFVVEVRELDGISITVFRVFESTDTPHVVKDTGAVYVRDSAGKHPVDQRLLFELAGRGKAALAAAQERFRKLFMPLEELQAFDTTTHPIKIYALAAPLTLTPHFAAWAISKTAVEACKERMNALASSLGSPDPELTVRPHARGFGIHWASKSAAGSVAVDAGGIIGARLALPVPADQRINPGKLRTEYLPRVIETVALTLERAEAVGRVTWEFLIAAPSTSTLSTGEGLRVLPTPFYASRELTSPSTPEEREALAGELTRELVRAVGVAEFEDLP